MGRELKRVALDFDWPLNKRWEGYLDPFWAKCPDCENGSTESRDALEHIVHLILIAGGDSIAGKPAHPWLTAAGTGALGDTLHEVSGGLAGRPPQPPFGHDWCDRWSALKAVVKAAGLPDNWGICETCGGEAQDPATKEQSDAWEQTEPPAGDGFQLWETTSEGSPVSPVFPTLDALCEWCANNATTFASFKASKEKWREMLDANFVSHQSGNMVFL